MTVIYYSDFFFTLFIRKMRKRLLRKRNKNIVTKDRSSVKYLNVSTAYIILYTIL